jgi:hypothetical protein
MDARLWFGWAWLLLASGALAGEASKPPGLAAALSAIRAVGPEGRGNPAASLAWRTLAAAEGKQLPELMVGFDGANPLAANWLRAAVEVVAERALRTRDGLPLARLGAYLLDTRHDAGGRRLAYDLIARVDPAAAEGLLPGLLNDPSPDLRRESVQALANQAGLALTNGQTTTAILLSQQALSFARDSQQIEPLAKRLRELGQTVDLREIFGWVTQWQVIGPFDNTGGKGFETVYGPETAVDLAGECEGKLGKVRWTNLVAKNEYGVVDVNQAYGKLKQVAAYAMTEFTTDREAEVELRLGCKNAWKVWVNGRFLFGREEYHRGAQIDQYRLPVALKAGRNLILIKLCQNELNEEWTVEWEFQLRVTDKLGTPVRPGGPPSVAHAGEGSRPR